MGVTANPVGDPAAMVQRLAPIAALLRTLAAGAASAVAAAGRLDAKIVLAAHLRDDAAALAGLTERLTAYGGQPPTAPEPAPAGPWELVAYDDLKPRLADLAARAADAVDPLLAEPVVRILVTIRTDQSRHLDERPRLDGAAAAGMAGGGAAGELLDVLHACVYAGERAASEYARTLEPRAAERAWTHLRHAAALDRVASTLGAVAGDQPPSPPADDPALLIRAWRELHGSQHPDVAAALGLILADL